jgi:hypothetical protein
MVPTVRVRANRVSREGHLYVALVIAQVFIGHNGGIAALLAATVRFDPKIPHETSVSPTHATLAVP